MTPNTDLLSRVLGRIEAEPSRWNQQMWSHQHVDSDGKLWSTFCFAGWTSVLAEGLDPDKPVRFDGYAFERAMNHLGLDPCSASRLFYFCSVPTDIPNQPRQVTFTDMVRRVYEVTGYLYGAAPQDRELVNA